MARPAHRPAKFTAAVRTRLCDLLRKGVPRERAARMAGISDTTFHRWMAEGAAQQEGARRDFRAAVLQAEDDFIARACAGVSDAFETDEEGRYVHEVRDRIAAARFMLPHRFPREFSTRAEVQTTGPDGGPVQVQAEVAVRPLFSDEQLAAMSPEQLAAALAGMVGR